MCPVARKLRLYIYCITSFPTGQLGQLGPVSSELPEQEQGVSWLPSTLVDGNHLVNGVVNWFENGLVGIKGTTSPCLVQAVGPEPTLQESDEEEDLKDRLQALRS